MTHDQTVGSTTQDDNVASGAEPFAGLLVNHSVAGVQFLLTEQNEDGTWKALQVRNGEAHSEVESVEVARINEFSWAIPQPGPAQIVAWLHGFHMHKRSVLSNYNDQYRARASQARAEFEAFKENAERVAIAYADRNNLCEEFDRAMEEIGLRGRRRDYDVEVTVTASLTITVNARNEDDATAQIDTGLVEEHLREFLNHSNVDYDVDSVDES